MGKSVSGALSKRIEHQTSIDEAYDKMFGASGSNDVVSIDIELLEANPNDPFRHYSEEKLRELAESIKKVGLLEPVIVRPVKNGKYEILSGKNRTNAVKINGERNIKAIVRNVDDSTAIMIITEANLKHRETLNPSEKGWAYRLQMKAISCQGKRSDLENFTSVHGEQKSSRNLDNNTSVQNERKLSRSIVAEINGVKDSEIQRYIRLTYLIPTLLNKVDENVIPIMSGVNISYLDEDAQKILYEYLENCMFKNKISVKLAEIVRSKYDKNGLITLEQLVEIVERKEKQKQKSISISISHEKIESFSDKILDSKKLEELFIEFLKEKFSELNQGGD